MHIIVEKTQTYISQYWEHLMTTKSFQIPWCRTYELTRAKITPTKQKFGTVGGAHQSERSRSMGSGRIISRYEWVLCWTESLNLAQKAETYHKILRLAIHWHNSSTILQGGDFLCWKDEKQLCFVMQFILLLCQGVCGHRRVLFLQYHAYNTGKASLVWIEPLELCRCGNWKKGENIFNKTPFLNFMNFNPLSAKLT